MAAPLDNSFPRPSLAVGVVLPGPGLLMLVAMALAGMAASEAGTCQNAETGTPGDLLAEWLSALAGGNCRSGFAGQ